MSKSKFFALWDKVSRIAQIFLKLANDEHNWKIQKLFWMIVKKLARLWQVGTPNWINGKPLARWHVKMRSWDLFGMLLRGHINHAGTHRMHGMWFSKLPYALWKCKCDHENYNKLWWYGDLMLPCDQREVWVDVGYWTIFCVSGSYSSIILNECGLFWVGGGGWDIIFGGWRWLGVYGALFWVVGEIFRVVGGGWGWMGCMHCLIMPLFKMQMQATELFKGGQKTSLL